MLVAVWIALTVGFVAIVATLALLVARGFRTWRTFRALLRGVSRRLHELESKALATEQKAVGVTEGTTRLADAVAHLEQSLETLGVLREAVAEARAPIDRLRGFVPRK